MDEISNQWINKTTKIKLGHTDIGSVTGASINYVTKYMFKPHYKNDERLKPFSLMSKGRKISQEKKDQGIKEFGILGYSYIKDYADYHIKNKDLTRADYKGNLRRLPRAYLKRIFTIKENVYNDKKKIYQLKDVPNKELIKELSEKNYFEHLEKKLEQYEKKIEKHYNNDQLQYIKSKSEDYNRQLQSINNSETL